MLLPPRPAFWHVVFSHSALSFILNLQPGFEILRRAKSTSSSRLFLLPAQFLCFSLFCNFPYLLPASESLCYIPILCSALHSCRVRGIPLMFCFVSFPLNYLPGPIFRYPSAFPFLVSSDAPTGGSLPSDLPFLTHAFPPSRLHSPVTPQPHPAFGYRFSRVGLLFYFLTNPLFENINIHYLSRTSLLFLYVVSGFLYFWTKRPALYTRPAFWALCFPKTFPTPPLEMNCRRVLPVPSSGFMVYLDL